MGKSAGFGGVAPWDPQALVRTRHLVMAADLRGWGESAPRHAMRPGSTGYSVDYQSSMRALLVGKTLIGMQIDDLLCCFDYLLSRPDVDAKRISLFGKNEGGVVALLAAALEPRIEKVVSETAVFSYMAMVRSKFHERPFRLVVPGVLLDFDLPDVAAAIAPRPVWIVDPRTPTLAAASIEQVSKEYESARQSFTRAGKGDSLRILERIVGQPFERLYADWMGAKASF
jgi:pimeloyl-ACP methyl ester carboxylesterase